MDGRDDFILGEKAADPAALRSPAPSSTGPPPPSERPPFAHPTAPSQSGLSGCAIAAIIGAVLMVGLAFVAILAAILFPVFQQAREKARMTAGAPGLAVNEPEFGVQYILPYGLKKPEREQERSAQRGVPYHTLSLTSTPAFGEEFSLVQVTYYPDGLGVETATLESLKESSEEVREGLSGTTIRTAATAAAGRPAFDHWIRAIPEGETSMYYYRIRTLETQDRLIQLWFGSNRAARLDSRAAQAYLDSLRLSPVSPTLKRAR